MKHTKLIALLTTASLLVACQQGGAPGKGILVDGNLNKRDVGAVGGAVAGGVIGSNIGSGSGKIAGTIAGTLLGGLIGSSIGQSLDNADLAAHRATSQRALETAPAGQTLPWKNPESGHSGSITPSNYYQTSNGTYCREFTQTITVGGQTEEAYGTACRQDDGTWKITQ